MSRKTQDLNPTLNRPTTNYRLLSVTQAAAMLGLAPGTLNKGRVTGGDFPPYIKISRSVRYRESSLISWLDGHAEHNTVAQSKAA
jgi:predicted DNA-binding transcriptional regulator AlpA